MFLYSPTISGRLSYIVDFISHEWGTSITIVSDSSFFCQQPGAKINYSHQRLCAEEFYIEPASLLFESSIHQQPINCFRLNNRTAFFSINNSDYPFDVLAASFYLLSRYEEYLPYKKNVYGCYDHTNSLAFKEGFLDIPLVNYWLMDLKKSLQQKFSAIIFSGRKSELLPTYDIDIAWAYKHKGTVRTAGSLLRHLITGNWDILKERITVLRNRKKDPFDVYDQLFTLHNRYALQPVYFFLVAGRQTGYDRNISPAKTAFQQLLCRIAQCATIGLHPSWQSGDKEELLQKEKKRLEQITGITIINSRQHYIRFTLPDTYRKLIRQGIQNEYSMGYTTINGFRASVASPFYWYDLLNDQATSLKVFPFCFMDSTAIFEQKDTPEKAWLQLIRSATVVQEVKGNMITIWHNNYLGSDPVFKEWRDMHERFLHIFETLCQL